MQEPPLGEKIKIRRKKLELTAEALALKCGIDRTYLSKIERHNFLPSPKILLKIVSELQDNPYDYLRLYEEMRYGGVKELWPHYRKGLGSFNQKNEDYMRLYNMVLYGEMLADGITGYDSTSAERKRFKGALKIYKKIIKATFEKIEKLLLKTDPIARKAKKIIEKEVKGT